MRKLLIVALVLSLTSCRFFTNGAGYKERVWGPDSSVLNNFHIKPEYQHTHNGRRYPYYEINGSSYRWQNETEWKRIQLRRYDYLWHQAEEKGINPHWYIDYHFNEDESTSY